MNTNQMVRSKESSLSATAREQKDSGGNGNSNSHSEESKSNEGKDNSYNNLHKCSGGICSTQWKPIPHTA